MQCFGLAMVKLDVRQESSRHADVLDTITNYLGLGSYKCAPPEACNYSYCLVRPSVNDPGRVLALCMEWSWSLDLVHAQSTISHQTKDMCNHVSVMGCSHKRVGAAN